MRHFFSMKSMLSNAFFKETHTIELDEDGLLQGKIYMTLVHSKG